LRFAPAFAIISYRIRFVYAQQEEITETKKVETMKYFKASIRCSECSTKFFYAVTEEEVEEINILAAMCPECGEMIELENLTPCSETMYEDIIEAYEDSLETDFEFDIEDFDDDSEDDGW
jgi:hypothetical protein